MLPAAEARLPREGRVLDVGGGTNPVARADVVLDLLPGATVQRDVCDRDPWPFDDDEFDFAVCSHTLEDVRDPIWVCAELQRVARAGYVEVPSRLEEQAWGVHGEWVGWSHHRWLVDVGEDEIVFAHKSHAVHREGNHFPRGFHATLSPERRIQWLWWEGSFGARERIFTDVAEHDEWLAAPVRAHGHEVRALELRTRRGALLRFLGS
ncbi:MAG: class I SAM-dependent methyltransferase [Actinomycetota bacterium]|nr:class I SAM-dependent methyltransferase [Actinomycetota bacterium]